MLIDYIKKLITPDMVSLWVPNGPTTCIDLRGQNHGQCFGTHPNVPVIAPPIDQISACDATTDWTTTGTSLSVDTDDKMEGTGSLKVSVVDPTPGNYYNLEYHGTWDWSDKEDILLWLKCDRPSTELYGGALYIYDTLGNFRSWGLGSFSAEEWTVKSFSMPAGNNSTPPPNLALITRIKVLFRAKDSTSFWFKIDDERITGKPSLINTAVGWRFGGDDHIDCGNDKSLDVTDGITFGGWVNSQGDQANWARVIEKLGSYWLGLNPANDKPYIGTMCAGGAASLYFTDALSIGTFVLLIATYEASDNTLRTFINGSLDTEGGHMHGGDVVPVVEPVTIGGPAATGYNAYIVLPFLANKVWSEAKTKNFYNATKGLFAPRG